MLEIEDQADISVARGCGFALLGIFTATLGLSWDMSMASEVAGLLTLLVCGVLALKAYRALHRPVQRTELWMMLLPELRPHRVVA